MLRREDIKRNKDGTFIQHDGDEYGYGIHSGLGRLQYRIEDNQQFSELRQKLAKKINALFGVNLSSSGGLYFSMRMAALMQFLLINLTH